MKYSKRFSCYLSLFLVATLFYSFDSNNSKISFKLQQKTSLQDSDDKNLVWIFFTDKGPVSDQFSSNPETYLTKESIQRRNLRVKSDKKFNESDLPVYRNYIDEIKSYGIRIKHRSKWFNGISCYLNKNEIDLISGKDFVKKIDLVQTYKKKNEDYKNIF